MTALQVAYYSLPGKPLDIKLNYGPTTGIIYDGHWMTGESAGNRLAGKNAALIGKDLPSTLLAAGVLHVITNNSFGRIKYLGETNYAGRNIVKGYKSISATDYYKFIK